MKRTICRPTATKMLFIPLLALASCEHPASDVQTDIAAELLEEAKPATREPSSKKPADGCDCGHEPSAAREVDGRYAVPVDDRPAAGPQDAPVTMVVFCDFACPYCKRFSKTLRQLRERHPDDVRMVFRQLPLPFHPQARPAALAALAAQRQGVFLPMHDLLFERQAELETADLSRWADELGLDVDRFERDLRDSQLERLVDEDLATARRFGARGTPSTFINGRLVVGARPLSHYESLVRNERAAAEQFAADHRVAAAELYETMSADWIDSKQ